MGGLSVQQVRLLDVLALGPFMIVTGALASQFPAWVRLASVSIGVLTMAYNWTRYQQAEGGL
jgi:hypothetical protein